MVNFSMPVSLPTHRGRLCEAQIGASHQRQAVPAFSPQNEHWGMRLPWASSGA